MTYQLTTLKNGLRVASEFLPGVESVAVAASTSVGARHESNDINGISHLLEHMAFKGTKTRTARDIAEIFDNIGGQLNAYTSMENTVYYAKVLKDDAALAVEILGDILLNSIFDEQELAREKDVIIQEIAMHRDSPEDLITDYFDETTFPDQPLGRTILGTEEKIASYTRQHLIDYMSTYYTPQSMVLTAAGNIDHAAFVALAERFFPMQASHTPPVCAKATYSGGVSLVQRQLEQLHLIMGVPAISVHDPDYYALQLYTNILGGGMSSRLFQEVREQRGLAYTVYAMSSAYADCGIMSIYAATSADKAHDLSEVLCDELKSMVDHIHPSELIRAKNQMKAELLMTRENPQSVASWIGRHLLTFGTYRTAPDLIGRIDAVTMEDLLRLSAKLAKGKLSIAALGDIEGVPAYQDLSARLAA